MKGLRQIYLIANGQSRGSRAIESEGANAPNMGNSPDARTVETYQTR